MARIVTLYDVGYDGDLVSYLATEYVDGESLLARLRRTWPLPLSEALSIPADMLRGVAYAHSKGIIHRDIKPANLLLTAHGQGKIADFDVARPLIQNLLLQRLALVTHSGSAEQSLSENVLGVSCTARAHELLERQDLRRTVEHRLQ